MAKKPLYIDCIAGSQLRDTQGEMLSVEGADISDLEEGKGRWNDNHGKGFFNSIGRITEAKKIFKAEDCDNDRHKYYWEKVKSPFIYAAGYLYDDEDHPNARAAAAIIRNIHKSDVPLKLKASVEGGVLSRGKEDSSLLARTKIHSVALTFTPANNATLVEPIAIEKSYDEKADMDLIKSVMHLAQNNVPSFRHITRDASANKVFDNLQKISEILGKDYQLKTVSKEDLIKYSVENKILSNVNKIKSLAKEIRNIESLDKGVKEAITGAMMGAASMLPSTSDAKLQTNTINKQPVQISAPDNKINLSRMPASHQEAYRDIADIDPDLGALGHVESSGGLNYKHKMITNPNSPHYKHTAGGMFAMLPNSAEYILRNDSKLANKYPDLAQAAKNIKKNHRIFTDAFNNDTRVAIDFASALLKRSKNLLKDRNAVFYSWNHGIQGALNALKSKDKDEIFKKDEYTQKALQARNMSSFVNKALTAGYGSAGAPTSNTGGGVLQSESIEKPLKGLKYITCDDCGKEQVYAKYQVKCRNCNKNWSLAKLQDVFKV